MPNNLLPAFLSTFYRPLPLPPSSLYHMASFSLDRRNGTTFSAAEAAFRYQKNKILSHVAFSLFSPLPLPRRSERSRGKEKEEEETEVLDPMVGRRRGEGRGAKRMEKP